MAAAASSFGNPFRKISTARAKLQQALAPALAAAKRLQPIRSRVAGRRHGGIQAGFRLRSVAPSLAASIRPNYSAQWSL